MSLVNVINWRSKEFVPKYKNISAEKKKCIYASFKDCLENGVAASKMLDIKIIITVLSKQKPMA